MEKLKNKIAPGDELTPEQSRLFNVVILVVGVSGIIFLTGLLMMLYAILIFNQPCSLK